MGSPVKKNQKYLNMIKELENVCNFLAKQYNLIVNSSSYQFYSSQMELIPPKNGPIFLRDNNSEVLVALVKPEEHYDHQQKSLVIDAIIYGSL